ncbi:MAG: hypothetical protein AAFY76_00510 [Cyanobacteria bacterium J06649_11]
MKATTVYQNYLQGFKKKISGFHQKVIQSYQAVFFMTLSAGLIFGKHHLQPMGGKYLK